MKKRIAGILISILALSALSGCGKEKDISYVDNRQRQAMLPPLRFCTGIMRSQTDS